MMDIVDWQQAGSNSGMQSADGKNVAIFVSCGSNPFAKNNKDYPTYGDGWASVARMQIIAVQELRYFADIKKDLSGRQISRHSANFAGIKATLYMQNACRNDISNCNRLFTELLFLGMKEMIHYEEKIKFYNKNKISGVRVYTAKFLAFLNKHKFLLKTNKKELIFIQRFKKDQYIGLMIKAMIEDMLFNLAPVADVYKNSNLEIEETIACIEALARVPQQVMKWGYLTTMATMQELYKIGSVASVIQWLNFCLKTRISSLPFSVIFDRCNRTVFSVL